MENLEEEIEALGGEEEPEPEAFSEPPPIILPFARRDLERLRLMMLAQRKLRAVDAAPSARQALAGKTYFGEALRWAEIHGRPGGPGRWSSTGRGWRASLPSPARPRGRPPKPKADAEAAALAGEEAPSPPPSPTRGPLGRPAPDIRSRRIQPMTTLSEPELTARLARLPGWERQGHEIRRTFAFADFKEAMAFVNRVADLAEGMDHHPDIDIRYSKVTLALTHPRRRRPHRPRLRPGGEGRGVKALSSAPPDSWGASWCRCSAETWPGPGTCRTSTPRTPRRWPGWWSEFDRTSSSTRRRTTRSTRRRPSRTWRWR